MSALLRGVCTAVILCATSAWGQSRDIEDARVAYNAGDFATAFEIASPLASTGDVMAMNLLGVMYVYGNGVEVDARRGLSLLEGAADQGLSRANYNLGDLYHDGHPDVPTDFALAEQYYLRAIELDNNPAALNGLGVLIEQRDGEAADADRVVALFREAMDLGHPRAQVNLGWAYWDGFGVARDQEEALRLVRAEVDETRLPAALAALARMSEDFAEVPADYQAILDLYVEAYDAGHVAAADSIGYFYRTGFPGVAQDFTAAVIWFTRGSDAGEPYSMNELALLLSDGDDTVPDEPERATALLERAAALQFGSAIRNLALHYRDGIGTEVDEARAQALLRQAIELGEVLAYANLGSMVENGQGSRADVPEALALYQLGAEGGDAYGGVNVAYLRGANGPIEMRDLVQSFAWCHWAVMGISRIDASLVDSWQADCDIYTAEMSDPKRALGEALLADYVERFPHL